ncbi:rhomboid family intramembrane serine protease [Aureimonas sp. AU40]|uniref:rhomboid family intramembrane serine protease n=1 Tax=Aureimonas sp. AU40 TaxID=1637747 RepID=UPI00078621A9|nr:rhomboid family intramembrane serine protease [Aureimonas sp. AU40]
MSLDPASMHGESRPPRPVAPINVPAVVLALIAIFGATHWLRTSVLSQDEDVWTLLNFALIPGCYRDLDPVCQLRETWAGWVSPVGHAFLHGDWTHFATNAVWLLAFGTPVARRLGGLRFLGFSAVGALAGAGFFYLLNPTLVQPMIGASGVVSALMGGAARFALGAMGRLTSGEVAHAPLMSIGASLSDRTILFFILIFFGTNLLLGSGGAAIFGEGGAIAWEAHVGGFLFGFLCFAFFDPRRQRPIEAI